MGGGDKKPAISSSITDFDVVFVGGHNAAAIAKFTQTDGVDLKMAVVTQTAKFVMPNAYFACAHGHMPALKLESDTVSSMVDNWSKLDTGVKVVKYMPDENKLVLSNGKEYTYKALVLSTGLDHKVELIEGLSDLQNTPESEGVFVHQLDKAVTDRNYYHGWSHNNGDMICYSPKAPYKGEGSDFYALYYESFMR